ncbi:MAG: FtsX-like permease family protein [Chloroflexota bacterium]
MITLLLAIGRNLTRQPWQTGLMTLGVALGVAVVIAIDLANASASRAFELSRQAIVGRATHRLVGGPAGVPQALYSELRRERGYRLSAPVVEGLATAVDYVQRPMRLLGLDPLAEEPFRSYADLEDKDPAILAALLTRPDAILLSADTAESLGLSPGDWLNLQVAGRLIAFQCIGILSDDGRSQQGLADVVVLDVAAAQEALGLQGRLSRIDLILTPDEAADLAARIPVGVRLEGAGEEARSLGELTEAFQLNLTALSLVALVVGMFLIYNTMMFSVVQHRETLGTLRALGLSSLHLMGMVLLEATIVAIVGAGIGVGLGWVLGRGLVRLVTQTINDLYYVLAVRDISFSGLTLMKGLGLGFGAALLGAGAPALEASRSAPVTVMQRSMGEARYRRGLAALSVAGLAALAAGALGLRFSAASLPASLISMGAVIVGMALLTPPLTRPLMAVAGWVLTPLTGTMGRMAARNVVGSLSRTGTALAALSVSVSVVIAVGAMITSFRSTLVNWLDLVLRADIYVSLPGPQGAAEGSSFGLDIAALLEGVPEVRVVEPYRTAIVQSEFGPLEVTAVDGRRARDVGLYRLADRSPERVWAEVLDGAVLASDPLANRTGAAPGQTLRLETDLGPQPFRVAAIYYDYSTSRGSLLMTLDTYRRFWDDRRLTSLGLFLEPGQDVQAAAGRVRAALAGTGLEVQETQSLRREAMAVFERTFAVTGALRLLAVTVAFIGILSALLALLLERSRELATLRALGALPSQVQRLVLLETGLLGGAAGLLSWPIGLVLAWVLVEVINLRSFGWTLQLQQDPSALPVAVLLSLGAAWLAAIFPLRRLAGMEISDALRSE